MAIITILDGPARVDSGKLVLNIVFVDDSQGFKRPVEIVTAATTLAGVNAAIRAERDTRAVPFDALIKQLQPGELDIEPVVVIPPDPTPEELARQLFGQKVQRFYLLRNALAAGMPVQAAFDAVGAELQKDYIESYEAFFNRGGV